MASTASSSYPACHVGHNMHNCMAVAGLAPNSLGLHLGLNPALRNDTLLGAFIERTFSGIFVLCFKDSCRAHTEEGDGPRGRVWWTSIQPRVHVMDGAVLDRENADLIEFAGCAESMERNQQGCKYHAPGLHSHSEIGLSRYGPTTRHKVLSLLSALTVVEKAQELKLENMLFVEADFVRAAVSEIFLRHAAIVTSPATELQVAEKLRNAVISRKWSVLRLSGDFYNDLAGGSQRNGTHDSCNAPCKCPGLEDGSALISPELQWPKICQLQAAPVVADHHGGGAISALSDTVAPYCDARDTSAFAVHHSAYHVFTAYLNRLRARPEWLRNGSLDAPIFDQWLPHALPNTYVVPTLVAQNAGTVRGAGVTAQKTAARYAKHCATASPAAGNGKHTP